jgi:hypothetical protein
VFELPAADKKARITQAQQEACQQVNVCLDAALEAAIVELGMALRQANRSYGVTQEEALEEQCRTEADSLRKLVGSNVFERV